jgi:hypothetical protein
LQLVARPRRRSFLLELHRDAGHDAALLKSQMQRTFWRATRGEPACERLLHLARETNDEEIT